MANLGFLFPDGFVLIDAPVRISRIQQTISLGVFKIYNWGDSVNELEDKSILWFVEGQVLCCGIPELNSEISELIGE